VGNYLLIIVVVQFLSVHLQRLLNSEKRGLVACNCLSTVIGTVVVESQTIGAFLAIDCIGPPKQIYIMAEDASTDGNVAVVGEVDDNDMLQKLKAFKERNGHTKVPKHYSDDMQLAGWVTEQRRQFKIFLSAKNDEERAKMYKETTLTITAEMVESLKELGFEFSNKNPRHMRWDFRYQQLKEFSVSQFNPRTLCVVLVPFRRTHLTSSSCCVPSRPSMVTHKVITRFFELPAVSIGLSICTCAAQLCLF